MALSDIGLTSALRSAFSDRVPDGFEIARVIAVNRTNLVVETESGPVTAETTGRLRFVAESSLELPAVGDWVAAQVLDGGEFAVVTEVLPRTTTLRRRLPGRKTDYQLMAANVDIALIVHPADQPVHVRRIERYLVVVREGGVEPVILLSKADLVAEDVLGVAVQAATNLAPTVAASSVSPGGLDALQEVFDAGRTVVLLGPSGVGKSTLINALVGSDRFATQEVRAGDRKGRHTTTRRELVLLPGGGVVIDTPGMRELGIADASEGVDDTFADIVELGGTCRFRDCTHTSEAGCAVLAAVASGDLDEGRYGSFLRLGRETAHYERSNVERRRRDREFGKLYKSIMKNKRDRR